MGCATVTLKDVAKACGVSVAMVSRAMNGMSNVDPAKAQMIQTAAAEMGYVPNAAALSLKMNSSGTIGVFYDDEMYHEYYSLLLNALRLQAEEAGYDFTLISRKMEDGETYYTHARRRNLDGVIIIQADFRSAEVVKLASSEVPAVIVDYEFKDCNVVLNANIESMEEMVTRAYELSHRRLAFIHGQHGNATDTRLNGFYKACAEHGLTVGKDCVLEAAFQDAEAVAKATRVLLERRNRPTCIFCPDDYSAVWCMREVRRYGLTVGKDVSVVGYDGIRMNALLEPSLATWRQDYETIAQQTVELLCQNINDPEMEPRQIYVPGRFQAGDSLGKLES